MNHKNYLKTIIPYNKILTVLEQAEKYYELAEKPDLPEKVKIQKHSCWQTMLKNGIMMQYDYDVLNDCANNFLQQNLKAARKSKSPFAEI